jgi:hypothetical protein
MPHRLDVIRNLGRNDLAFTQAHQAERMRVQLTARTATPA